MSPERASPAGGGAAGNTGKRGPRPAQERLRRLLVMLPWLMERGGATVAELAERFHVRPEHVVADLERASLCGLPPYVDELIDLWIEDGVVHIGVPRLFTRPLRLTPAEGFSLMAAGRAALELPGAEPDGPLARALVKLERVLGARPSLAVELARPPHIDAVQAAVDATERLAIAYLSGDDERTERTIAPHATFARDGIWYVVADCALAGGQRTFRIDRMESVRPTGERFAHVDVAVPTADWFADDDLPAAVLVLDPAAAWVTERYPTTAVTTRADGRLRVELPVASERWLGRLLVRLGPQAAVEAPVHWRGLAATTAATILTQYRTS